MPAAEKYSRILQPPLPVLAGHDCDGKREEKEVFRAGLALSVAQKVRHHTLALEHSGCGQWKVCSQSNSA